MLDYSALDTEGVEVGMNKDDWHLCEGLISVFMKGETMQGA